MEAHSRKQSGTRIFHKYVPHEFWKHYDIDPPHYYSSMMDMAAHNFNSVWRAGAQLPSRFSDGSWPVLYAAIDAETARTEKAYWLLRTIFGKNGAPKKVSCIQYGVNSHGTCLEIKLSLSNKHLVHPDRYNECIETARGAIKKGVSFMIVPSARHVNGSNMPSFCEKTCEISGNLAHVCFEYDGYSVSFSYDTGDSGVVTVSDVYGALEK